jgi:hypothetical protein
VYTALSDRQFRGISARSPPEVVGAVMATRPLGGGVRRSIIEHDLRKSMIMHYFSNRSVVYVIKCTQTFDVTSHH